MVSVQEDLDRYPVAERTDVVDQVPVVDIEALVQAVSAPASHAAIESIASACREWGFFQVVNHGIDKALIEKTLAEMRSFFNQERTVKDALLRTRGNPWGYYNNELTKNQRDKKEVFDFTSDGTDSIYGAQNRWPQLHPDFRNTMCAYRDAVTNLGLTLLDAFCVGLGLPADFMRGEFENCHTGFVRLNYYPVEDPLGADRADEAPIADLGVHHHTDAGALTVLLQDEIGGLQVFNDGYWHNVRSIPDALVINTGDMMQVWSNDIYHAAVHRVLAMDTVDRCSIPFFFNPSAATVVKPLPSVINKSTPPRYRSIRWSEFRGKRTDGDYADYGPEVQIAQYRII